MKYWVDDRLVEADDARVSVLDHGFTVADGVFETLKVVAGTPFALTRHLRRLATSASGLGLPAPDGQRVREAVAAVCAANRDAVGQLGRLRVTYTAGPAPLGSVLTGRPFSAMPRFSAAATRWDRRTGAESISTDISTP